MVLGPHVDVPHLAGAVVVALQGPAAARRAADGADEDDVAVLRVHRHVAALSGARDAAVLPCDGAVAGARGHADAGVVLLGAVDDVVRRAPVGVHGVELRRELVVDGAPGCAGVERHGGAAVVALDHAPVVVRVDPQIVVVAVRSGYPREVRAGVGGLPHPEVVDVHRILVPRVREDVHVVPGAVAQVLAVACERPGLAEVLGAVEAGRGIRFDQRPYPPRSGGRRGQSDLSERRPGGHSEVGSGARSSSLRRRSSATDRFPARRSQSPRNCGAPARGWRRGRWGCGRRWRGRPLRCARPCTAPAPSSHLRRWVRNTPRSVLGPKACPSAATHTRSGSRGWIRISLMCRVSARPRCDHVRPASVDRYTPSPWETSARMVLSPVPA